MSSIPLSIINLRTNKETSIATNQIYINKNWQGVGVGEEGSLKHCGSPCLPAQIVPIYSIFCRLASLMIRQF